MAAIILLLAAFAIRSIQFGNPQIHVDENFYLLVGDRMLHGALPYVDIWDRKPIGLFLIYAAIRLLGGEGIVQYQVVATLFVAATAFVIARIAATVASRPAAVVAGLLYMLMLGLAGGMGGQAPVFYNLFVAGAALLTLRALNLAAPSAAEIRRLGAAAMALCGVALQIKYSAVFEGIFFGIVFVGLAWRATRDTASVAAMAGLWIAIALVPTALAFGYYVWLGEAQPFLYANFLSIGARSSASTGELLHRLWRSWRALQVPILVVILSIALKPWRHLPGGTRSFSFILAWLGAALAGYLVFGSYFDHYVLPLLVPIAVAGAPLFSYRPYRLGPIAACLMLLAGCVAYYVTAHGNVRHHGGRQGMEQLVAAVRPRMRGCLFVYDGDSMLYYLTRSCIPTRYAFPQHLTLLREAGAIGVDPIAELRRILAGRPHLIVDTRDSHETEENPAANALVRTELRRDYRPVASVPHRGGATIVYERIHP